jgi:lysyl-tRNA synthetase class 1
MLAAYDEVMAIMLPSLREERQQSYSPFLPISPKSGAVLQVPILERNVAAGTIVFRDPDDGDRLTEVTVTGGNVKCQWKADWAMRWTALGIDYEMSGKDLIDSVKLSTRICAALGGEPPEGFNYELFLDEKGQKISKSKGNGLTIDEWLTYAAPESLSLYMFNRPRAAKRLYFDVIPKAVDEYFDFLERFPTQTPEQQLGNPVWHIHAGRPPQIDMPVTFTMLLNLASASNTHDKAVLWGFIRRHLAGITPETHPKLDELIGYAVAYYNDFVLPTKVFRAPDDIERGALAALDARLSALPADADPEAIQTAILDIARAIPRYQDHERQGPHGGPGVSVAWFSTLYEILLGQPRGPRFGSFVAIYGIPETRALVARALAGELAA